MATAKRERQKAARREKLEAQKKRNQRRQTTRRVLITVVVAAIVIASAAIFFSKSPTKTVTIPTTTTPTTLPPNLNAKPVNGFATIADASPAGTWGKAPTLVVPTTAAPKVEEAADLITGTGPAIALGDKFKAEYVLATYSTHKVVQSSWTQGGFSDTLSKTGLIPGWVDGMVGMKVGTRRELIIPPALGYGSESPGTGIAANDTLVFIIDLLSISK